MTRRLLLAALLMAGCAAPLPPIPIPTPSPTPTPAPSVSGSLFRLCIADSPPDADFLTAILAASSDWNEATGREVFGWLEGRPVRLAQFAGVEREGEIPCLPTAPACSITAGVTFPGLVVFSGRTPANVRYTVAAHELGHVIGLSHSADPADLMFPKSRPDGPSISPNDTRRALEALGGR